MLGFSGGFCISASQISSQFSGTQLACRFQGRKQRIVTGTGTQRVVVHCRRGGGSREFRRRGDGRRPHRVAELIRREISPIIDGAFAQAFLGKQADPPVFISVVEVRCSDDLRSAKVSVSVLGTEQQKTSALQWLRGAKKEIRFELAQCVRMKYIPELSFTESEVAQAVRTVNILDMLAKERQERQSFTTVGVGSSVETVEAGVASLTSSQDLDLDASAEDAILFEDLDGFDDDGDEDEVGDGHVIEVTDEDEELEGMSDEKLKRTLFNTLESDDFVR